MLQQTLKRAVTLTGRGLHTNAPVKVRIEPSGPSKGLTMQRMVADLHEPERLTPLKVCGTPSAIDVEVDGRPVKSVEHLLAALYGMGVDNANIQVSGEELPAMDGSAWPFVRAMARAGICRQKAEAEPVRLDRVVSVSSGARYVIGFPASELEMCTVVDYDHPAIGRQIFHQQVTHSVFLKELVRAKTFGWPDQIAGLRAKGLARGGSHANALIFGKDRLENPKASTYRDEPVRHKTLDLLAAFALLGGRLQAHVVAIRPGHALDVEFVKAVYREVRPEPAQGGR